MSETLDDYVPEAEDMIVAYALYKCDRMGADWKPFGMAYREAKRFIESVKQEAYEAGQSSMTEITTQSLGGHNE